MNGSSVERCPSVAVEGLPGAGKTTLVRELSGRVRDVMIAEELMESAPGRPHLSFFIANDRAKERLLGRRRPVLMDRYWPSTAAYTVAEQRYRRRFTTLTDVVQELFGGAPLGVSAFVFLDPVRVVDEAYAADGLFAAKPFRRLLRQAYFEIFASLDIPVLIVDPDRDHRAMSRKFAADVLAG